MKKQVPLATEDPISLVGRVCLNFNVRKASRVLARAYDEAFAHCDLKSTQFPILVVLHNLGAVPLQKLALLLDIERTTLIRNLKPLKRRGLVETKTGDGRRVQLVAITDVGEELLQEAMPGWAKLQEKLLAGLGGARVEELLATLKVLAKSAGE